MQSSYCIVMIPIRDHPHSQKFPYIIALLITINVLVFGYELTLVDLAPFLREFAFTPAALSLMEPGTFLTLFSSQFLHGGFEHIILNMWFLWIFGDNVEEHLGRFKFVIFYLLGGAAAALLQFVFSPESTVPMLGASGSISAVLGYYLLKFPHHKVETIMFWHVRLFPADIFLGLWFVMQFVSAIAGLGVGGDAGGVAWWAHIGGFIFGMIVAKVIPQSLNEPKHV